MFGGFACVASRVASVKYEEQTPECQYLEGKSFIYEGREESRAKVIQLELQRHLVACLCHFKSEAHVPISDVKLEFIFF